MSLKDMTTVDYLVVFFSGVGATVFGFLLTMVWEWRKSKKQEKSSLATIVHELETNALEMEDNKQTILQEIKALESQKIVVKPLLKMNNDFPFFLNMNCPSLFKDQINLLEEMRKISKITNEINETIQSRESYRVNNGAMTNYENRIKIYDEILLRSILQLEKLMPDFVEEIKAHINKRNFCFV